MLTTTAKVRGGGGTGRILIICGVPRFALGILTFILAIFAVAPKNSGKLFYLCDFFFAEPIFAKGIKLRIHVFLRFFFAAATQLGIRKAQAPGPVHRRMPSAEPRTNGRERQTGHPDREPLPQSEKSLPSPSSSSVLNGLMRAPS